MSDHSFISSNFGLNNVKVGYKMIIITGFFLTTLVIKGVHIVGVLEAQRAAALQLEIATRQSALAQQLVKDVAIKVARNDVATVEELLRGDIARLFETSQQALTQGGETFLDLEGREPIILAATDDPDILQQLDDVQTQWQALTRVVATLSQGEPSALQKLDTASLKLVDAADAAAMSYTHTIEALIDGLEAYLLISNSIIVLIGIAVSALIVFSITRPLVSVLRVARSIANGDLSARMPASTLVAKDELGSLSQAIEQMRESLAQMIQSVKDNSLQMAHSSHQVASISQEISDANSQQQNESDAVLAATQALMDISTTVSQQVETASSAARETEQQAQAGIAVVNENIDELTGAVGSVNQTSEQMQALSEATGKIHEIVDSIQTIADQTNLLALNAAIEAARAGEHGRGFAVVADEVRGLASRTSNSTSEIAQLIADLTEQVSGSVAAMEDVVKRVHASQDKSAQAVSVFEAMTEGVQRSSSANQEISSFNEQQNDQVQALQTRLDGLFNVLRNSSAKSASTAIVADELFQQAEQLKAQLGKFDADSAGPRSISRATDEKRHHPRMNRSVRVSVCQGDIVCPEGVTKDISLSGLRIRLKEMLDRNTRVNVQILPPRSDLEAYKNQQPVDVMARIVRMDQAENDYEYGLNFDALSHAQQTQLEAIFAYFDHSPEFG